jgi:cytochrome P450
MHSELDTMSGSNGRPTVDFDHFAIDYPRTWKDDAARFHAAGVRIAWSEHHGGFWVVASWDGVQQAAADWRAFTSENDLDGTGNGGRGLTIPQNPYRLFLGESDPPEHTGRRRLETPYFTPKAMQRWRSTAQRFLHECIDRVVASGSADLIDEIIIPTAARTTLHLLGYDPDDWQDAAAAARRTIYLLPTEEGYPHAELTRLRDRFRQMLADRADSGGDDLISHLAQGDVDGQPLGLDAGESMMNALVFGGFDTTATLTATALLYFQEHQEHAARYRDDESIRRNAVEEMLRVFPPASGIARTATHDTELLGQEVRAGEPVFLWFGAANLDPTVFPDPEHVDFDRPNAREHVTFSAGPHRCLGSLLAKLEIIDMLEVIPRRLADLRIDLSEVKRYPKGIVSGFVQIPATFKPGTAVAPAPSMPASIPSGCPVHPSGGQETR